MIFRGKRQRLPTRSESRRRQEGKIKRVNSLRKGPRLRLRLRKSRRREGRQERQMLRLRLIFQRGHGHGLRPKQGR